MELKTNSKCQLIVDGLPHSEKDKDFVEVIVSEQSLDDYYIVINRAEATLVWDMPTDGMYLYYGVVIPEGDSIPEDFIKTLVSDPTNLYVWKQLKLFSICKLRNCLLQLEREIIEEFVNTCKSGNCAQKSQNRQNRDLLLIALFLLENLICQERYSEASIILNRLNTCGDICGNRIMTRKCNC